MNNQVQFNLQALREYLEESGETVSNMTATDVFCYAARVQGWQDVGTSLQTGAVWGRPASGEKMTKYAVDIAVARGVVSKAIETLP